MNHQLLIHDYIDGTLDAVQEDILFAQMAENQSLRAELNEQMRLHRLAKSDMAATSVPPDITASVFGGLGIPLPAETPPPASPLFYGWGKWLSLATAAILSSVLTVVVLTGWWNSTEQHTIPQSESHITPEPSATTGANTSAALPLPSPIRESGTTHPKRYNYHDNESASSGRTKEGSFFSSRSSRVRNSSSSAAFLKSHTAREKRNTLHEAIQEELALDASYDAAKSAMENIESSTTERREQTVLVPELSSPSLKQEGSGAPSTARPAYLHTIPYSAPLYIQPSGLTESKGLSLMLRGMPFAIFTPNISAISASKPDVNNIGAGLYYAIGDDHEFGIEVGRESYIQQYTRSIGGQSFEYRQNPALYFYGLSYRYTPSFLRIGDDWAGIYVQGAAAWAQNGPLFRGGGGIILLPQSRISLFGGGEYSYLYYPVQSTYFSSSKIAFTFGAALRW